MPRSQSVESTKSRKDIGSLIEPIDPFLVTFDKPTQIYRYLRTRFALSPLFLHRTLSYMKGRCTRRNPSNRKKRQLEEVIDNIKSRKVKTDLDNKLEGTECLTIGFIRFSDDALKSVSVSIETKLQKIARKGSNASNEIFIGKSTVTVNFENSHTNMIPAVCISKKEFNELGINSKDFTYQLTFDIKGSASTASRKESLNGPPPPKQQCQPEKTYTAELPIFDKSGNNLIYNGFYETLAKKNTASEFESMNRDSVNAKGGKVYEWLAAQAQVDLKYCEEDSNPFDAFEKGPKIHMCLEWTKTSLTGHKYIKKPEYVFDHHNNNNNKENLPLSDKIEKQTNGYGRVKREEKPCLIQFVVNPTTKQRTEERYDFTCPWCILKCPHLYGLIYHLRLCHSRMLFQLVDEGSRYRVDVFLNEAGSTSYEGAPHRLLTGSQPVPTRKSVVNQILVMGPRKLTFDLNDFQDNEDLGFDQQHHHISGHNRIYYHTDTCIPIMPKELEYDSEGEPDPEWLQKTTKQMIDEFTDVNDGEKELMKLWNLHCMKHLFVGDCHVVLACRMFIEEKGNQILEKNLKRNYFAHLQSMSDFGLLSTAFIMENYTSLLKLEEKTMSKDRLKAVRDENMKKWISRNPNPTQTKLEKDKPKKPELTTPSTKRRSEHRLSRNATTPKGSDEKPKKFRKISS